MSIGKGFSTFFGILLCLIFCLPSVYLTILFGVVWKQWNYTWLFGFLIGFLLIVLSDIIMEIIISLCYAKKDKHTCYK